MDSSKRTQQLSEWVNSTQRPSWMRGHPVSAMIVAILIDKGANTHDYSTSVNVLAATLCCGPTLVKNEINLLETNKWITKTRSVGSANWYMLTGEYLNHIATKIEVSADAKSLALWFRRELQQKQWNLVRKYNQRRSDNPKRETSQYINAARVLALCGTLDRAKEMAKCAVALHTQQAIQSVYNLHGVLVQKSFAGEFEEWLKNPTAAKAAVVSKIPKKQTDRSTLNQLVTELAYQKSHLLKLRSIRFPVTDQQNKVDAANDDAARFAMSIGIAPKDFPPEIYDRTKYEEIFTSEYQKEAA